MDPASAAVTFLGAGAAALKACKQIHRFSKMVRGAKKGIDEFEKDVEAFYLVIDAVAFFNSQHSSDQDQTPVTEYMNKNEVMVRLEEQCGRVVKHIEALLPRIESLQNIIPFIVKLRWASRRKKIGELHPKMESVKSNLAIVMTIIRLEAMIRGPTTPEIQREIKRLRREIRRQAKEIVELRAKQVDQLPHNISQGLDRGFQDVQNLITELADNMVHNGEVPAPRNNPSPPASRRNHNDPSRTQNLFPQPPSKRKLRRSRAFDRPKERQQATASPNTTLQANESHSSDVTETSFSSNSLQRETTSSDTAISSPSSSSQTSSQHQKINGGFLSELGPNTQALNGTMYGDGQSSSFIGFIDPDFPQNVVSAAFAREHDLEVRQYASVRRIHFGNEEYQNVIGTVTFQFITGKPMSKGRLPVTCFVLEHGLRPCVLGRQFVTLRLKRCDEESNDS